MQETTALLLWLCTALLTGVAAAQTPGIADIPPGHWWEVPDSRLDRVAAHPNPGGALQAVMTAWNGAAFDTRRERLLVWGGGHRDYAGNEVYAFDLKTLTWQRLTEPSTPDAADSPSYADGGPRAPHTYASLEYLPQRDALYAFGLSFGWPYGKGYPDIHALSLSDRDWNKAAAPPLPGGRSAAFAAYDAQARGVWCHAPDTAPLLFYDIDNKRWKQHARSPLAFGATAAVDPERGLLVAIGHYRSGQSQMRVWNVRAAQAVAIDPAPQGDRRLEGVPGPGFQYDPIGRRFVGWGGGGTIYALNPDTWTWRTLPAAAGNRIVPSKPQANGTYGRFRYVPAQDVFVLVNRVDENVFIYRPERPVAPTSNKRHEPTTAAPAAKPAETDIVSVRLQGRMRHTDSDIPVTFGHVFKPGAVPRGARLLADDPRGAAVPLQVDAKAVHGDGSLRHAVLTARLPASVADTETSLTLKAQQGVDASTASPTPAVTLEALMASGFDAEVALRLPDTVYRARARALLNTSTPQTWLAGPEVSEWIVGGPVRTSAHAAHPHLTAYFHVRAYRGLKRVRVDVVVENSHTFTAGPGDHTYDVEIRIGGKTVYALTQLAHYSHARWHRQIWWGEEPVVDVMHDKDYLQDSGAVPKYAPLTPSEGYLASLRQAFIPMTNGDLTAYFPQTGAQAAIGPLPRWTATYLVSMDPRAYRAMRDNDDHAGTYGVHYRDEKHGHPVSIADYPAAFLHPESEPPIPEAPTKNPYRHDQAHQPSLGYVSYLVSGDYYYLEELLFWASWNHLWSNARTFRRYEQGLFSLEVRGQAWAMRTLGQAAYITPDNHRMKMPLAQSLRANLAFNDALYAKNPAANTLGVIRPYGGLSAGRPWKDDFYTFAMGYLVDLGFREATPMRDWKARYVVQRLGEDTTFCWLFAAHPAVKFGPADSVFFPNFGVFWEANWGTIVAAGVALRDVPCDTPAMTRWLNAYQTLPGNNGNKTYVAHEMIASAYPDDATGYYANQQPAVAVAVDAAIPGAARAGRRFYVDTAVKPDYTDMPQWAIIPRTTHYSGRP